MNTPSITFLYAGGTISSKIDSMSVGLVAGSATIVSDYINNQLKVKIPELLKYKTNQLQVYRGLSEDMGLEDIEHIYDTISGINDQYIIVLHGTDRMSLTAKFIHMSDLDSKKKIIFVGSQRSPDLPSYEGVDNIFAAVRMVMQVRPGVYVLQPSKSEVIEYSPETVSDNYRLSYQLLDPVTVRKQYSYSKNCYIGEINYELVLFYEGEKSVGYQLRKLQLPKKSLKLGIKKYKQNNSKSIQIVYPLPGLDLQIHDSTTHVILVSTGLLNVSISQVLPTIEKYTAVKFYLCNDIHGLKYPIYARNTYLNLIPKSDDIQMTYLRLLYDPCY